MMFMDGDHAGLKELILRGMRAIDTEPGFLHAVEKLGRLVTVKNRRRLSAEEWAEWEAAIAEGAEDAGTVSDACQGGGTAQ